MKSIIGFSGIVMLMCTVTIVAFDVWGAIPLNVLLIKQVILSGAIVIGAFLCIRVCMTLLMSNKNL